MKLLSFCFSHIVVVVNTIILTCYCFEHHSPTIVLGDSGEI